jgi:ADP-ribose pyrophosphatase YjhB (NUDIX family)
MTPGKYMYCPHCGRELEESIIEQRLRERCPKCERVFYVNPLPVVSCLLVNSEGKILLVLRKNDPHKNMWCLPMGFAEVDENIQQAALRELEEETNVKGRVIRLLDAETAVSSHYGNMVIIAYEVEYVSGEIKAGDDARDVRFFPMNDLPELAFKANLTAVRKYQESYGSLD